MKRTRFALACLLLTAALSSAQSASESQTPNQAQTPPAAQQPSPASQTPAGEPAQQAGSDQQKDQSKGQQSDPQKNPPPPSGTSNDRLFFTLPNFLTLENAGLVPPLTTGQKFKVVARGSFDYVQYPWYGFLAGISQAENSEPGFGQGANGYGKRYGAYFADGTIENFFTGAILPSILKQDPRFFQSGHGSFFNRTGYAVSRIFVTRTDSGHNQFNYSEIVGAALASAISTYSYHPGRTFRGIAKDGTPEYWPSDRTLKNTASVWGSQVGYDTLTLVVKEFWPDIRRKLKKQHNPGR